MSMSQHLAWEYPTFAEGTTPSLLLAWVKSRLLSRNYQVLREDTSASPWIDVIPPSTEVIGGNGYREFVRLYAPAGGNALEAWIAMEATQPTVQQFTLSPGANYAVSYYMTADTNRITIAGESIPLGVVTSSNVAAIAEALRLLQASTSPAAQLFTYALDPYSGGLRIVATAKAAGASVPITVPSGSGANGAPLLDNVQEGYAAGGILLRTFRKVGTLPVDYTYGFVLYLEAMGRTLYLGTRTQSVFGGPLALTWVSHQQALDATPAGCTPVELLGVDLSTCDSTDAAKAGTGSVVSTHFWGYVPWPTWARGASITGPTTPNPSEWNEVPTVRTCCGIRGGANLNLGVLEDTLTYYANSGSTGRPLSLQATAGGLEASTYLLDVIGRPAVAALGLPARQCGAVGLNSRNETSGYATSFRAAFLAPGLRLDDVYAYCTTATNETVHLITHPEVSTTLQTVMDASSDYSTLDLADASSFPNAGSAILGSEKIAWTGRSGNTLSGVTRGLYGSARAAHAVGDPVALGLWMIKINGAAIPVGTTRPIA